MRRGSLRSQRQFTLPAAQMLKRPTGVMWQSAEKNQRERGWSVSASVEIKVSQVRCHRGVEAQVHFLPRRRVARVAGGLQGESWSWERGALNSQPQDQRTAGTVEASGVVPRAP